ncbi:MAG: twin-arginine translocation signal domain-containing protein, partial [Phycisphaerales bacterium]
MKSLDKLSRREFLGRTCRLGAAGLVASQAEALPSETTTIRPAGDETWQIGCYTRPWANYDYRVALDAIAEAGF